MARRMLVSLAPVARQASLIVCHTGTPSGGWYTPTWATALTVLTVLTVQVLVVLFVIFRVLLTPEAPAAEP